MGIIINPGSENKGGTLKQAKINAEEWLKCVHDEGFLEVEMEYIEQYKDGNFLFNFKHNITKKVATLEIHGFTKEECQKFRFHPRVYWNGSSTSDPEIENWLTDEFTYRIEFYKKNK